MYYDQATVSLKVVSRKRRRKCTLKLSYDRFTNSKDLRLATKSDRKVKSGGRYSQVVNRKPNFEEKKCYLYFF